MTPLVDFLICGTQKGGTTALYHDLRQHPAVCMAGRKEVHFFDDEAAFAGGAPDYAAYHAAFSPTPAHRVTGEATPIYMYWHAAPRRIWEYNPAMKLVVVLRNPIERAYSHWNMETARQADDLPFAEAVRLETERCRAALPLQHRVHSYVDRGFYLEQLRRLWTYFPKTQVLVLRNESLRARPRQVLDEVCAFIGVPPLDTVAGTDVHSHTYAAPMGAEIRAQLRAVFEYDIKGLERALGWDCSDWLNPETLTTPQAALR
jgi:hypothetical protein